LPFPMDLLGLGLVWFGRRRGSWNHCVFQWICLVWLGLAAGAFDGIIAFSNGSAWLELGSGAGAVHGIIAFPIGSAWFGVGLAWFELGLAWFGRRRGSWNHCLFQWICLVWAWFGVGLAAGEVHGIAALSPGSAWFGFGRRRGSWNHCVFQWICLVWGWFGLGLVWPQARYMESLPFPMDLLGLGLVWPQVRVTESSPFPMDLLGLGLVWLGAAGAFDGIIAFSTGSASFWICLVWGWY